MHGSKISALWDDGDDGEAADGHGTSDLAVGQAVAGTPWPWLQCSTPTPSEDGAAAGEQHTLPTAAMARTVPEGMPYLQAALSKRSSSRSAAAALRYHSGSSSSRSHGSSGSPASSGGSSDIISAAHDLGVGALLMGLESRPQQAPAGAGSCSPSGLAWAGPRTGSLMVQANPLWQDGVGLLLEGLLPGGCKLQFTLSGQTGRWATRARKP